MVSIALDVESDGLHEDEFFGKTKIIKNLYKISFKAPQSGTKTKLFYQGCSEKGFCYPLQSININ